MQRLEEEARKEKEIKFAFAKSQKNDAVTQKIISQQYYLPYPLSS
jgi:hypothetical protein